MYSNCKYQTLDLSNIYLIIRYQYEMRAIEKQFVCSVPKITKIPLAAVGFEPSPL